MENQSLGKQQKTVRITITKIKKLEGWAQQQNEDRGVREHEGRSTEIIQF